MKCPSCGSEMLKFPVMGDEDVLSYYCCIDCVPPVRIIEFCTHRRIKYGRPWCTKMSKPCNPESDAETGYIYCPQIREWQEQQADWVKGQNKEFEEKEQI